MARSGSKYAVSPAVIADVHKQSDQRGIPIDRTGVSDVSYPIVVFDRNQNQQHTFATISMGVNLRQQVKGTHMSRFIEILNEFDGEMTIHTLPVILRRLKERLGADTAHMEVTFPFFLERVAPESGAKGLMDHECSLIGQLDGDQDDFILRVRVPVASLCPCSKKISDYGAHNQRGYVTIDARSAGSKEGIPAMIWAEDLIDIAEKPASAPVYPLLKRPDERYVTMRAYDNPVFVEDIARGAAKRLEKDQRIAWFQVQVVNHESIHSHDVFACVEWTRPKLVRKKKSNGAK